MVVNKVNRAKIYSALIITIGIMNSASMYSAAGVLAWPQLGAHSLYDTPKHVFFVWGGFRYAFFDGSEKAVFDECLCSNAAWWSFQHSQSIGHCVAVVTKKTQEFDQVLVYMPIVTEAERTALWEYITHVGYYVVINIKARK